MSTVAYGILLMPPLQPLGRSTRMLKWIAISWLLLAAGAQTFAQTNSGQLQVTVLDPARLPVSASVRLISQANLYDHSFATDDAGIIFARRLPFGLYELRIQQAGFAPYSALLEIRSAIPLQFVATLAIAASSNSVIVPDTETLIDPHPANSADRIGNQAIQDRVSSLPGRSLQDLVNTQPGWLYEGNAVLHPRGSEYQTQFVLDGIPLTDNRSPSFGPEVQADDLESIAVYTAAFPAEFGRKLGGVVELNSAHDTRTGFHGENVLSGGSFSTLGGYLNGQYLSGKNTVGFTASGDGTARYLNPVVPQNFTNNGTTAEFAARYERELTANDRLSFSVRHELSRYEIPNEQLQQAAGQKLNGDNFETMGIVSYQHVFSSDVVADLHGMVRDHANDLTSNLQATPVIAFQHDSFREGYFKGTIAAHRGRQEWKAGLEVDSTFLQENFSDTITDLSRFDPGTPKNFLFTGRKPDLEQAAFVQDQIRLGRWTFSAGLRWDHYQLLVNENAFSPRLSVAYYFPAADLVLHASYDRIFETPSADNLLVSSSPGVVRLNPQVLSLPVRPSHGNFYEVGVAKGIGGRVRLDGKGFSRRVNNYADDDQLLSTAVSFPISFAKAYIYGAEGKLEVPHWWRFSGFASYSYIVGSAYLPVTGGLFLGNDAADALNNVTGRFWDSQDQRNTVRARIRYQLTERIWLAGGAQYGSGLPFRFSGSESEALAQYGPEVVSRIDFSQGRVRPNLSIDISAGLELLRSDKLKMRLQADATNLNDRLNVIDFAGLFSGNAIAPPRSFALRLQSTF